MFVFPIWYFPELSPIEVQLRQSRGYSPDRCDNGIRHGENRNKGRGAPTRKSPSTNADTYDKADKSDFCHYPERPISWDSDISLLDVTVLRESASWRATLYPVISRSRLVGNSGYGRGAASTRASRSYYFLSRKAFMSRIATAWFSAILGRQFLGRRIASSAAPLAVSSPRPWKRLRDASCWRWKRSCLPHARDALGVASYAGAYGGPTAQEMAAVRLKPRRKPGKKVLAVAREMSQLLRRRHAVPYYCTRQVVSIMYNNRGVT